MGLHKGIWSRRVLDVGSIYHPVSTKFVVKTTTIKKEHPQNCRCCFVIYYKLKKKCQLLQASKQTSDNHVVCVLQ